MIFCVQVLLISTPHYTTTQFNHSAYHTQRGLQALQYFQHA